MTPEEHLERIIGQLATQLAIERANADILRAKIAELEGKNVQHE